jgi:uncharacterized protein (TIGR03437 family)
MLRTSLILCCALTAAVPALPDAYVIRPAAGVGRGDSGSATAAVLDGPDGLAEDAGGNLYVAEANAGVIRRIRPGGMIERFAGSGAIGDGPEGQPALETDLTSPAHLLIDGDGGLIFADLGTCRIRKVRPNGTIQDLVGTGSCTAGGFGGGGSQTLPGPQTQLSGIGGLARDASGRLVFTEQNAGKVRRLDTDGYVRTIAGAGGAGYGGDEGTATSAYFRYPAGLAFDGSGNLYIGDGTNCVVRIIDSDGGIDTFAGTGTCATSSSFWSRNLTQPLGRIGALTYDAQSNSLFVSCPTLHRVVRIDLGQSSMVPLVGSGQLGTTQTSDPQALTLNAPSAILASARGVFVADNSSFQVYRVKDGAVATFAGGWPQVPQLVRPSGVSFDTDGSILVADEGSGRVLRLRRDGALSVQGGSIYPSGYSMGDGGRFVDAVLNAPTRLLRGRSGELYIVQDSRIRVVDAQGTIKTLLALDQPTGIVLDSQGRLIYSDAGSQEVVRYDLSSKSRTVIAGTGTGGFSGDKGDATDAELNSPGDLAFDSGGNLLIADRANRRVRRIASDGTIRTIIGSDRGASFTDITGQLATGVGLGQIDGMAVDQAGNIYIAESRRISVVSSDGRIRVVAGFLSQDDNGVNSYLGGPLTETDGLAVDQDGRIYYSVPQDGRVMIAVPPSTAASDPPSINAGGVISASGFGAFPSAALGSFIEIYGWNLATTTRQWTAADFDGLNAPTTLDGTSVTIGGQAAFIAYISPTQVNALVPGNIATGTQPITLTAAAGTATSTMTVDSTQPGLFAPPTFNIAGKQYVGALFPDGVTWALPAGAVTGTTSRPARAGETIVTYGIGFGPVTPPTDAGRIVQGIHTLTTPIRVFIGNAEATVAYAGQAPSLVGLYQFNVVVPSVAPGDALPLTFTLGGVSGQQTLYIAVQQ